MVLTARNPTLFGGDLVVDALSGAPNPKPSTRDKRGFGRLASLYTAFSTEFARFAVEVCRSLGHRRIADPFAGMGTLGEATRGMGIELLLNDFNPFAVTSCCFRTASAHDIHEALDRIRSNSFLDKDVPENVRFAHALDDLLPVGSSVQHCLSTLWDPESRKTALSLHLLALLRIATHRRLRGSNPTWTKRSDALRFGGDELDEAMRSVLAHAYGYAEQIEPLDPHFKVTITGQDVTALPIDPGSLDAIITSPPYPNRTDYIRHYLPAAELLLGGDQESERRLRQTQIGTPLIRPEMPSTPLPDGVRAIIERIRLHKSYASERYYAKGFLYYFSDIQRTFGQFTQWLSPEGTLIVVVQDTYYKELLVPVADLFRDIGQSCGLELQSRQDFNVRHPLSRLSPHSRASIPKRQLRETALMFRQASK